MTFEQYLDVEKARGEGCIMMERALFQSKPSDILQGSLLIDEPGKTNFCVVYYVADFVTNKIKYTCKPHRTEPDIKYYLHIAFCQKPKNLDFAYRKKDKYVKYYKPSLYEKKLVYGILRKYMRFSYLTDGSNLGTIDIPSMRACYELFEKEYEYDAMSIATTIKPKYLIDTQDLPVIHCTNNRYSISAFLQPMTFIPLFSVSRQDYLLADVDSFYNISSECLEHLWSVKSKLYEQYNKKDAIFGLYPELQQIAYDWIDGKLPVGNINKMFSPSFCKIEGIDTKLLAHTSSVVVHKQNDFKLVQKNGSWSKPMSAIYDYSYLKKEDSMNNLCVFTENKVGSWCRARVLGLPTEDIEKKMTLYIYDNRLKYDVCDAFENNDIDYFPGVYCFNLAGFEHFDVHLSSNEMFRRIPSFLWKRYRKSGYLMKWNKKVEQELIRTCAKRRMLGFLEVNDFSFEYDANYKVKKITPIFKSDH